MTTVSRNDPTTNPAPIPGVLDAAELLQLYERMVLLRQFELTAQQHYRAGEMPGFIHLYVGEEATAVGACAHLRPDDWITSTHRGHGHALAKGVAPEKIMAELYGKATGCCGGRGGSMHLYDRPAGLFGTNGFVGGGLPSTVGAAISAKTRKTDAVAVAFFGDGAVNHGAFHESVNFAGIQNAPVIFLCENNLYATATPLTMATRNTEVATKSAAYGIPGAAVDGQDVLAVWEVMREAVTRARSGQGPTLIESKTYRFVGHHEGDQLVGTYRTEEELETWKKKCPIATFRRRLLDQGLATEEQLEEIDGRMASRMEETVEFARSSPDPDPATGNDHVWADPINPPIPPAPSGAHTEDLNWLEATRDGIAEEMRRDPHIIYFGEGTGERGGTFAHTKNLYEEFGAERMIDTPIAELGFTGASIGASATGCRAIADLMFVDFIFEAASQVIEQAGKLRYMSNGQMPAPVVIRAGHGTVRNTGPHHSGAYHPVWAHCPGLLVAVPSTPADAKGLFKTALRAGDPVLILEPKSLFSIKGPVPVGEYLVPFGVARVARPGRDLSIVTCGQMVSWCLQAANVLSEEQIDCEVIDLRTIVPLDVDTIVRSVSKTSHLLVVDEAYAMCGIGAEIAAVAMEHAFDHLDAPVGRLHTDPVAQPFGPALENAVVVNVDRIADAARSVLAGRPPIPRRPGAKIDRATITQPAADPAPAPDAKPPAAASSTSSSSGVQIIMPQQDLTITEATIVRWLHGVGDTVTKGEPVVEVETDKATFEIESPASGTLVEVLTPDATVVALGQHLGTIEP